ncbi:MAG: hypothetical protein NTY01_05355 [Verrucomicrobia bacterium]|nr:hypothetical protein [Verrucomicrobiota bacterium]
MTVKIAAIATGFSANSSTSGGPMHLIPRHGKNTLKRELQRWHNLRWRQR